MAEAKFPYAAAIEKIFVDPDFQQAFMKDGKSALASIGVTVDDGVEITSSMTGNAAGGNLHIDVKGAKVNWNGSATLVLSK